MKAKLVILGSLVLALAGVHVDAAPVGTSFTYHGRLTDGANPANGIYYMFFTLHDALSGGTQLASQPTNAVTVSNGLFTADLDFGAAAFAGEARWLKINVRTNGGVGIELTKAARNATSAQWPRTSTLCSR